MKLTGPQIQALEAALIDAFRNRAGLARMVRIHLERNLNEITEGADLTEVTFSLIEWAERTGSVSELIGGAVQANSGNARLNAFYADWQQDHSLPLASISTAQELGRGVASLPGVRENPTINRSECILLFQQLLDPNAHHRFLHVTGGPKMGKSHLLMKLFPAMAAAHNARCAALDLRGQTAIDLLNSACALLGYELTFPRFEDAYQHWSSQPRAQVANMEELLSTIGAQRLEQDEQQRILPRLTRAFAADLHHINDRPLVLIFDRVEEASPELQRWLMDMLLVQLGTLPHVCLVAGGRTLPDPAGSYAALCLCHTLESVQDEAEYKRFCRAVQAAVPEESIGVLAQAFSYSPGMFAETIATQFMAKGD